MDAATLGAVGTIVVGLAATAAAYVGNRGANRASQSGAVLTGYGGLVDNLQEERDKLQAKLGEAERQLSAAYAELSRERADKAGLQGEIVTLRGEIADLHRRIIALGGQTT
jgi:hypothetical protein